MTSKRPRRLKIVALFASGAMLLQLGPCVSDLLFMALQSLLYSVVGDSVQTFFQNIFNV